MSCGLAATTETAIRAELADAGVPGAAIAWIASDGLGTLEYGLADVAASRRVDPQTQFHLFSGTKLYTAAAVMRLVERGEVALDAAVRTYLPDLAVRDDLTVRHLLSHASGLGDTLGAFLSAHIAGERAPSTAEALARYRLGRGTPGRSAAYRNVNYAIAGELVSRVSRLPYVEFVRSQLLEPLGAELSFEDTGRDAAVGYVSRFSPMWLALRLLQPEVTRRLRAPGTGNPLPLRPYSLDTAAIGGLVGPATAFVPFLREMLCERDGLLRAASKREMLTLQARGAAGVVSRDGVGLGWKRGLVGERVFWNHEGGGAGFCSETRLYLDAALGLVILLNRSQNSGLSRTCHRIAELLRSDRIAVTRG